MKNLTYIVLLLSFFSCSNLIIINETSIINNDKKKQNGIRIFNEDSTQFIIIEKYKNGYLHGKYYKFFPNGNIAVSGSYYYGKKNKKWKHYYSDGQLGTIQKFKKGKNINVKINNISW